MPFVPSLGAWFVGRESQWTRLVSGFDPTEGLVSLGEQGLQPATCVVIPGCGVVATQWAFVPRHHFLWWCWFSRYVLQAAIVRTAKRNTTRGTRGFASVVSASVPFRTYYSSCVSFYVIVWTRIWKCLYVYCCIIEVTYMYSIDFYKTLKCRTCAHQTWAVSFEGRRYMVEAIALGWSKHRDHMFLKIKLTKTKTY